MASIVEKRNPKSRRIRLGAELVLGTAAELHAQLSKVLPEPGPVVLDAAAVTRLDTSALQLLQAFVQARGAQHHVCRWDNVGAAIRDAATLLGLQSMLDPPATGAVHS